MSDTADKIIDATMALLADRPFEEVTLRAIATEAGISLGELNQHFSTRGHILSAFSRRIDQAVLANEFSDMVGESGRDRLFDVLMSRLDALSPHKAALKSLMQAARRDPAVALGLNTIGLRGQSWMLAAAGLSAPGWRGRIATQSLAVAFAKVLRTFVDEDDPGMPRTMARLDKELRELESRHKRLARVFGGAVRPDDGAAGQGNAVAPQSEPNPAADEPLPPAGVAGDTEPSNGSDDVIAPGGSAVNGNGADDDTLGGGP
ncbi:MAG: TetR family transcriptional regulator [Pseudomonadota bacterium]